MLSQFDSGLQLVAFTHHLIDAGLHQDVGLYRALCAAYAALLDAQIDEGTQMTFSHTLTSHETIFHGCTPMLIVEMILTVYPAGAPIEAAHHRGLARKKPYEWLVVGDIAETPGEPPDPRFAVFDDTVWAAHYVGLGDDTAAMMDAMRQHILEILMLLFPLDDKDDLPFADDEDTLLD